MILTVTANPCVDKTYRVENFTLDRVNRPSLAHTMAGGKGVNVARVYRTLGGDATATGLLGGLNGKIVAESLAADGIVNAFHHTHQQTRVCIAVIDPVTGTQTEINEPGPDLGAKETSDLCDHIEGLLSNKSYDYIALCGSLPPGMTTNIYSRIIQIARRKGVPSVLDASGDALSAGIMAQPWLVKPNRFELEEFLGHSVESERNALDAAQALHHECGISQVIVTLGSKGALLVNSEGGWMAKPPAVQMASAVASGDSFLAAFLWAVLRKENWGTALKMGVGAGAANAEIIGAGLCSRADIQKRASQTELCQR